MCLLQTQPPDMFCKKGALYNLTTFTGKHVCLRLQHTPFPVNLAKFLRTPILKTICERLLLFWFRALSQAPPEPSQIPVEFQDAFDMTQRLTNLPYNYRPTKKTLICSTGYIIYMSLWQITYLHIHFCCYGLIGTKDVLKEVYKKVDSRRILV